MEQSGSNKTVTISFMLAGILIGIFTAVLMETLATVTTGAFGRFVSQDFVRHGLPVVVGFATFIYLQTNKGIHAWGGEVALELSRVVWPSRKDTTAMTVVVCIMVLVSGAFFGLLDVTSGAIITWLLHQNFLGIFG